MGRDIDISYRIVILHSKGDVPPWELQWDHVASTADKRANVRMRDRIE